MDSQDSAYLDVAYRIFTGEEPPQGMTARQRCVAVMQEYDGRKLNNDDRLERVARSALCVIGLNWHHLDGYPYGWTEITERIRELTPSLGTMEMDAAMLRRILRADREGRTVVCHVRR